jgi:hypothetical protein
MQLIFFVPPNEELEIAPPKIWMYPKNEGKRVHVPPDEKTCGHAACSYASAEMLLTIGPKGQNFRGSGK